ncbi:hypothetical protein GGI23_004685 [Coemansia sp. RSA 2559]|nr:hypothetical protein GGI23_004685 [Coemansia sp. RSA 2559]
MDHQPQQPDAETRITQPPMPCMDQPQQPPGKLPQEKGQPGMTSLNNLADEIQQLQQEWETSNAETAKSLGKAHARKEAIKADHKQRMDAINAERDRQLAEIDEAGKEAVRDTLRLRELVKEKQELFKACMELAIPKGKNLIQVSFTKDLGNKGPATPALPLAEEEEKAYHEEAAEAHVAFGDAQEWASAKGMNIIAIAPGPRIAKSLATKFGNFRVGAARASVTASLDEGVILHNVSRIGDKSFELLLEAEYCAETSYRLYKAGWNIMSTTTPSYQVAWRNKGMSVTEADTYARWEEEAKESRSPRAREYYKTLLAMHSQQLRRAISEWQEKCHTRSQRGLGANRQAETRSVNDSADWALLFNEGRQAHTQPIADADGFIAARPAQKRLFNENGTATTVSEEMAARTRPRATSNQYEILSDEEDSMAIDEEAEEDGQGTSARAGSH